MPKILEFDENARRRAPQCFVRSQRVVGDRRAEPDRRLEHRLPLVGQQPREGVQVHPAILAEARGRGALALRLVEC